MLIVMKSLEAFHKAYQDASTTLSAPPAGCISPQPLKEFHSHMMVTMSLFMTIISYTWMLSSTYQELLTPSYLLSSTHLTA